MFCENCGKEITGDIRFCPECGTQIRIPHISQKSLENNNQNLEFGKRQKPVISLKDVKKEKTTSIGYKYNFGHFCAFIGAALEILSLFLPNKSEIIKMKGITMLDYLKIFVEQIYRSVFDLTEESEADFAFVVANIIIIVYFIGLILCCIQRETNSLILTSLLNMAVVGFVSYKFHEYAADYVNVILGTIQNERPITGLGYWLFLISGIVILVSSIIANMLGINEKYKMKSKGF